MNGVTKMNEQEELDLKDIFNIFWTKKWFLVIAVILGAIIGAIYSMYIIVPKYSSSTTMLLSKPVSIVDGQVVQESINQNDIALNQKLITTYEEIIKSRSIINMVISNLQLDMTYEQLIKCIKVVSVKNTDVMKVTVTTVDKEISAQIANEIAKVFMSEIVKFYRIQNISIVDVAQIKDEPVNVNLIKDTAVFSMAFLVLAMIIVFLMYYFDVTIKTSEDIEKALGVPVLSVIPKHNDKDGGKTNGK